MAEALGGVGWGSLQLFAQMAPYLLLGLAAAGGLHVALPVGAVARLLGGPGRWAVVRAAALGVPLPLCSCGVVPVAASLQKSGASRGAVVSFLISTPTSGVDSILATYALMGPVFAVVRPLVSGILGVVSGLAVRRLVPDARALSAAAVPPPQGCTACGCGDASAETPGGRSSPPVPPCEDSCCGSPAAAASSSSASCADDCCTSSSSVSCADDCCTSSPAPTGVQAPAWRRALSYAFGELLGDITRPLLLGLLLGGVVHWALPEELFAGLGSWGWLAYPALLLAGVPLYVCASGSIPVAAALLAKGVSPGAALVFLVVGPATNAASLAMLGSLLGRRALVIYLVGLTVGAVVAGLATDLLFAQFPTGWASPVGEHAEGGLGLVYWASAGALGGLMLYQQARSTLRRRAARRRECR